MDPRDAMRLFDLNPWDRRDFGWSWALVVATVEIERATEEMDRHA